MTHHGFLESVWNDSYLCVHALKFWKWVTCHLQFKCLLLFCGPVFRNNKAQGHSPKSGGVLISSLHVFLVLFFLLFTMRPLSLPAAWSNHVCELYLPSISHSCSWLLTKSLICRYLIMTFYLSVTSSSTRRVDNSNTRLVVQIEKDPGKKLFFFTLLKWFILLCRWMCTVQRRGLSTHCF